MDLGWFESEQAALGPLHPHHRGPEDVCGISEIKAGMKKSSNMCILLCWGFSTNDLVN